MKKNEKKMKNAATYPLYVWLYAFTFGFLFLAYHKFFRGQALAQFKKTHYLCKMKSIKRTNYAYRNIEKNYYN